MRQHYDRSNFDMIKRSIQQAKESASQINTFTCVLFVMTIHNLEIITIDKQNAEEYEFHTSNFGKRIADEAEQRKLLDEHCGMCGQSLPRQRDESGSDPGKK